MVKRSSAVLGYSPTYEGAPFVDFEKVTPRTRLETLNLNWREHDLPERARTKHVHRLHPYLGKYIPQLVEIFLRKYRPGIVCDPFCGSGTTLVEASVLGINAVGCDISEFNCLLSRVKTGIYAVEKLDKEAKELLLQFQPASGDGNGNGLFAKKTGHSEKTNSYLREWFAPEALHELLVFRGLIGCHKNADLFKVVLSRSARSARLTTHFDLDFPKQPQQDSYYCYKHDRTCQPTRTARQFLTRYLQDGVERVREYMSLRKESTIEVISEDARGVDFPEVDLILTSPPYVGLIDYHEQHRYAYELLGLTDRQHHEIGPARLKSGEKAKKAYQDGISEVFFRLRKRLSRNGRAIIVVNDRHGLYEGMADRIGFKQEAVLQRHVNRRTGMRSSDFFESILIWKCR